MACVGQIGSGCCPECALPTFTATAILALNSNGISCDCWTGTPTGTGCGCGSTQDCGTVVCISGTSIEDIFSSLVMPTPVTGYFTMTVDGTQLCSVTDTPVSCLLSCASTGTQPPSTGICGPDTPQTCSNPISDIDVFGCSGFVVGTLNDPNSNHGGIYQCNGVTATGPCDPFCVEWIIDPTSYGLSNPACCSTQGYGGAVAMDFVGTSVWVQYPALAAGETITLTPPSNPAQFNDYICGYCSGEEDTP